MGTVCCRKPGRPMNDMELTLNRETKGIFNKCFRIRLDAKTQSV